MDNDDFFEIIFNESLEVQSRLDYIFEIIDEKLSQEKFNYVNQILAILKEEFVVDLVDNLAIGIGFLTVTMYVDDDKVPNRESLGELMVKKFREKYPDKKEDPYFKGLI